ncbi:MAG: HEAT repeat domain-containing protein [Acidimicrobiales bacterium]|nr:HEAT repeat domain-containing protein [Acidimicrobiales bacterium]
MSLATFPDEANQLLQTMRLQVGGVQRVTEQFKSFDRSDAVRFLTDAASSTDDGIRCDAIEVLKAVSPEDAYRHVLGLAGDQDPMMRFAALDFLAEFQKPESLPIVLQLLRSDPDGMVRYKAASVLADIGDASVLADLERAAASDDAVDFEGRSIREVATRAIAAINARAGQGRS